MSAQRSSTPVDDPTDTTEGTPETTGAAGITAPAPTQRARAERALRAFHEEDSLGKSQDWRHLSRLWAWVRPYKGLVGIALAATLVTAGAALARPLILRFTIDQGVAGREPRTLLLGGVLLAVVLVVEQLLTFAQVYAIQVAGARAVAAMRRSVFEFLHRQRLAFFEHQPVGRLVTRVTNDTDAVLELFASGVVGAVGDLVRLAGIIILMVTLEPRLAGLTFIGLPPVAVLLVVLRRYYRDAFREIRAKTARMNATMNEQVAGITVVQSFRREGAAQREFDEINGAYRDANIRAIKYEAMQDAAIDCIAAICIASMMVYVGYAPVSFGTLVAFNVYVFQFFEPISTLSQRYTLLQSALAGAERIFGLMDVRGEEDAPRVGAAGSSARSSAAASAPTQSPVASNPAGPGAAVARGEVTSALAFEHVTFRYKPGRAVLEDVDFSVARGEKVALVGPTGSGKSTITALLLRLYDVREGEGRVTVAGRDVRDYDRHDLRTRFSVVPQDVFLFPGSLASNVAFSEHPDEARVKEVLERIGALDLFQRRPDGIRAKVTERGSNFSAGERQLIAFARALYRDSDVLILDEATASVDSDTEARLQRALETLLTDRTAIVIAHRLATIRKADRILVLKQGHIVEQGDHEALLAHGGLYARLHALQSAAESHGLVGAAE